MLQSFPGQPAFPIRLASEIFLRIVEILNSGGGKERYSIYDPFCGSGYMITTLCFLHTESISKVLCSDINSDAISTTISNLGLLSIDGLEKRISQLENTYKKFNKASHLEAIENAKYIFKNYLTTDLEAIPKTAFCADAFRLHESKMPGKSLVDIIMSDLPYGNQTVLEINDDNSRSKIDPLIRLIESFSAILRPGGIVALISQEVINLKTASGFKLIHHFKIGHRHIYLSQFIPDSIHTK